MTDPSGLVDGEQPGVANDWGLSINSSGQVGAGLGNPDRTQYSPDFLDTANGEAHLAIYSRSGGSVSLAVDGLSPLVLNDGGGRAL